MLNSVPLDERGQAALENAGALPSREALEQRLRGIPNVGCKTIQEVCDLCGFPRRDGLWMHE